MAFILALSAGHYLNTAGKRCLKSLDPAETREWWLNDFSDLLEKANEKVCYEALQKVDNIYNNLIDHDYLVVTGGTGDAWKSIITEYYSGMDSLKIINGNQNDMLPTLFSTVRGYYLYIVNKMKRQPGNV